MADYLQQPGSSYQRDQTGIRRIELVFDIPGPTEAGGEEPYAILDAWSPNTKPLGLEEIDRKSGKRNDGGWDLHIGYAGSPNADDFGLVVEIDYATQDVSLQQLPTWLEFKKKYGAPVLSGGTLTGWAEKYTDPNSGKQVLNPWYGETHYHKTYPVLRVSFGARKFSPGIFKNCGRTQKPPTSGPLNQFDEVLQLPDNMTWLKRTVKGRFYGNCWQFSLEYLAGVWNPDVYAPKDDDNLQSVLSAAISANVAGGRSA